MMGGDSRFGMMPCSSYQPPVMIPHPPIPTISIKMPRVVPDQKSKFENDELFRSLSRECRVSLGFGLNFQFKFEEKIDNFI